MDRFAAGRPSIVSRIAAIGAVIGGVALMVLMMITVFDIAGRHLGFGSIRGLAEISGVTVIFLACLGLSYCFLVGGHLIVDIATAHMKPATLRRIDSFWSFVAALLFAGLAALLAKEGFVVSGTGEKTAALGWSPLVFYAPAALGFGATAITCLYLVWRGPRPETPSNETPKT